MNRQQGPGSRSSFRAKAMAILLACLLLGGPAASIPVAATAARSPDSQGADPPLFAQVVGPLDYIVTDTTWTLANSPYTFAVDVDVAAGTTLTIEPGVEVRFGAGAGLQVHGKLQALGTFEQPIILTGTSQQPGAWDGIALLGSASVKATTSLEYVTISYGGGADRYGTIGGNLYFSNGSAAISHSAVEFSGKDGLYAGAGSTADISDSRFQGNSGFAIRYFDGSVNPALARLTASENGTDAISLGLGFLTGAHVWENAGLAYLVTQDVSVREGSTLTVEPGVVVRFAANAGLEVRGKLVAAGSPHERVRFTGTNQVAGAWDGIFVQGRQGLLATARFEYVDLEYGGAANRYDTYGANLYLNHGVANVSHSLIRGSGKDGVSAWNGGSRSLIESSQIVDNAGYGVRNAEASASPLALLAPNNWWGSPDGPTVDDTTCGLM